MFTVATLLYGPHPDLAQRLLESLAASAPPLGIVQDVRIGLNEVSDETRQLVLDFIQKVWPRVPAAVYSAPANVGKYPLLRRMLYDTWKPCGRWMWFDDDSHLAPNCGPAWWTALDTLNKRMQRTLIGVPHYMKQRGRQHLGIVQQPWYTGQPVLPNHSYYFITGGWWIADPDFLKKWDWPFPELHHSGGDSILGELLRQQRASMSGTFFAQCCCESCMAGNPPRKPNVVYINDSPRRGLGSTNERYIWQDYDPVVPPDLAHHAFECRVERFA